MKYNVVKNADRIIENSDYLIKTPSSYKNNWSKLFGNNNPICLELGMGRGSFIIEMAKKYPKINFIGLELDQNQTATAVKNTANQRIPNLKMICDDAGKITDFFGKEIDTIYLNNSDTTYELTNVFPNTGISLPFISYGGSSVLVLLVEIGLVLNVCRDVKF